MPGIVTNPTAGDVHLNVPLTNFSQKFLQSQSNFISMSAMPNLPVTKQSDKYFEFSRADFFRNQAKIRADGTESAGIGFTLSDNSYFAEVYAIHKDVTDRQRANQDAPIQLDLSSTQLVTLQLLIKREELFQTTFMPDNETDADTAWGTTNVLIGADPGVPGASFTFWDNAASDPIVDIRNAIRGIQSATGFRPNKMAFGRSAWDTLLDNGAILERILGGSTTAIPAIVMRQLVAQLFELEEIHVSDSVVNSAVRGATEATDFAVGDNALLYFAPSSLSLNSPSAGAQFSWTGFVGATPNGMRMTRIRSDLTQSDRIEGEMAFDYKITSPELGFYFFNVRTPPV